MSCNSLALFAVILSGFLVIYVHSHGYLYDPPGRSTVWRIFPGQAPANYDDNAIYCGGYGNQYNTVNQGRCGECGDEWSKPRPRDNEEGGKYGQNLFVTQKYTKGNIVRMSALITASHFGYLTLKLCPSKKSINELVTQDCFDRYPLRMADGTDRVWIDRFEGWYDMYARLPADVTCEYCVVQWTYTTGNNNGNCGNGTSALGCGNQETFRNCADVAIV